MKKFTSIILTVLLLCLFASFFTVAAIGFDAEEIYESVFVIYTEEAIGSGLPQDQIPSSPTPTL